MAPRIHWKQGETEWMEGGILHISVPFTYLLPKVQARIKRSFLPVRVGGPAVMLMPDFLQGAEVGGHYPGALQKVHPLATRTTMGCPGKCRFCGVGIRKLESGGFTELEDFFPGNIVCDNNLMAASIGHLERVVRALHHLPWVDFQGLDIRLITEEKAALIGKFKSPTIRIALDSSSLKDQWERAFHLLNKQKIRKSSIRTYVLCGYRDDPSDAWERCTWVKKRGSDPLPMWYHRLDCLEKNEVTEEQTALGWSDYERRRILQWWYQKKRAAK